jgi:hypothetical protein
MIQCLYAYHEGRHTAPFTGTKWRWAVTSVPWLLYCLYPTSRRLDGPQKWSEWLQKRKIPLVNSTKYCCSGHTILKGSTVSFLDAYSFVNGLWYQVIFMSTKWFLTSLNIRSIRDLDPFIDIRQSAMTNCSKLRMILYQLIVQSLRQCNTVIKNS